MRGAIEAWGASLGLFEMPFFAESRRFYPLIGAFLIAIVRWATDALADLHAKETTTSDVTLDVFLVLLIGIAIAGLADRDTVDGPRSRGRLWGVPASLFLFVGIAVALLTALLAFWRVAR